MKFFDANRIETPFSHKNDCWFCGEPYKVFFTFPHHGHIVVDCSHPTLSVPACSECCAFAKKAQVDSIWQVNYQVKHSLYKTYEKDLAIGVNWTPETLAETDFEGGNFEGFQKSAWFMYEVAKNRVNYSPWPIVYQGKALDNWSDKSSFTFDGVEYPNIDLAISQYVKSYQLNKAFFMQVLNIYGKNKFAAAVRFCRLYVNATPLERDAALKVLED